MKKTIIYTVIFLLSIQIALALYGGESFNLYEGECAYLDVNVEIEPEQNLSEYSFNCEFISLGNFTYKFDCPNNYIDLDIIPEINSVGNYTIVTSIFKERYVPSGDGSTHYSRIIKDIPVKRIILEKIIEAEDEDEGEIVVISPDEDISEPTEEKPISYTPYIIVGIGIIFVLIALILLCSRIIKKCNRRKLKK